MRENARNRVLKNIASPYGLAIFSYAFFLFACFLPPSIYVRHVQEPDLMFLDSPTILFYSLCVAAFLSGVWLMDAPPSEGVASARRLTVHFSPMFFLLTPLLLGIALTALSTWRLLTSNPEIIWWLLTQQGGNLKGVNAPEVDAAFTFSPLLLIASIWFVFWRASDIAMKGWRRLLVNLALLVSVLMVMSAAILTLNRALMMMLVCGLAILYVVRKTAGKVSVRFVLGTGALMVASAGLLFAGVSFLRGTGADFQVDTLFGYTVASYNRLAAMVHGDIRYPFAGRGVYLSGFVSFSHLFNQIVPLSAIMNWPSYQDVWSSEFGAVAKAGLDGGIIWSGAFGYIFSDLGWFSPALLFIFGILYGLVWNWVRRGRMLGIVIYPCIGFCVLFWIGSNYLFDSQTVFLYFSAALLAGYDRAFITEFQAGAVPGVWP